MRYIDADRLNKQIEIDSKGNEGQYGDEWQFIDTINSMPTADVRENVKAHWIDMKPTGDSRFMCSRCRWKENVPTVMGEPTIWNYCPSCGAEMGGKS